MKKKMFIILGLVCLVILGIVGWIAYPFLAFFYYASDSVSDDVAKSYMKKHYNVEITVVDKYSNALELGETTFTVMPKGEGNKKFTMVFSTTDDSLISEDYVSAVKANQELDKMDKEWPAIDKLGFKPAKENGEEQVLLVFEDFKALNLMPKEKIKAPPLKDEDLDRLYQLTVVVLNSGAVFDNLQIRNSEDGDSNDEFSIPLAELKQDITKAEFKVVLKQGRLDLAAYEIQEKWEPGAREIENDRFQFKTAGFEEWVFCHEINKDGICSSLQLHLKYADNGLKQSNPNLKDDLGTIFNYADDHLQSGMKVDIVLEDGQRDVFIPHDDRMAYQNTDELTEALFVE